MNQTKLEDFLDNLYQRHTKRLSKLELVDILLSKTPYLFHILGLPDGTIDWEKLVRFNSGKETVTWISSK